MKNKRTIKNAVLSLVIIAAIVTITFTGVASRCVEMIAEAAVEVLGLEMQDVTIIPGDVVIDELPAKVDIKAYGVKRNGDITDHVKWRLLSENGEEAPIGIMPLASPEHGTLTVYITEPGVYIAEVSAGVLEDKNRSLRLNGIASQKEYQQGHRLSSEAHLP